jgi:uncharacterized protein (DUF4415 family)
MKARPCEGASALSDLTDDAVGVGATHAADRGAIELQGKESAMKDDAPYKAPHAPGYVSNPHYSQEDWNEVSDNPEWTEEDFANAKPFAEAFPDLAASFAKSKAAKLTQGVKAPISIRLSRDVI